MMKFIVEIDSVAASFRMMTANVQKGHLKRKLIPQMSWHRRAKFRMTFKPIETLLPWLPSWDLDQPI